MSVSGGKYMAFESGKELSCEAIQIFVRNVRGWTSGPLKQKEIDDFISKKEELKNKIWPVISHNSYLINLASIDDEKLEKSYNAMIDELTKVDQLNIEYANMHPGVIPIDDKEEITAPPLEESVHQMPSSPKWTLIEKFLGICCKFFILIYY